MRILSRAAFREIATSSLLGIALFSFVFFLRQLGTGQIFALMLRSSAEPHTIAYLLTLLIPPTLPFTVPVGVLVGILIGLSRMSSDNEVTAMRAAGVPARVLLRPVLAFAFLGLSITAAASLWITPWAIRETIRISNKLAATQLTAEIQPRVFEESFPNTVLYVGDVVAGPTVEWRKIFIADLRPPDERKSAAKEAGDAPPITIAAEASALPDAPNNRIQLSLRNGFSHEAGKEIGDDYNQQFPKGEQILEAQKPDEARAKAYTEVDTLPLKEMIRPLTKAEAIDPKLELNQRFALPCACVLLGLIGVPLGASSRKAGKSSAFVLTVVLGFLYYVGLLPLIGLARQGKIPPELAIWTPNTVFAIASFVLLARLEQSAGVDLVGIIRTKLVRFLKRFRGLPEASNFSFRRIWILPQVVDTYILSSFLFYFILLLISFVLMVEIFTFFELLGDIVKHQKPMSRVLQYLFFLSPKLIYDSAPIAVLVGVLVTFGVLTKNNEVTAFKACGISMYRLSLPVLLAAALLSCALFAFDHYYIPEANRKQDALRNEIKGKPVQTFLKPDRKWIFGQGSRIYYYKYFEPADNVMSGVSVYELDPETFHLKRLINAELARWEPSLKTWVFQNGQVRTVNGIRVTSYSDFHGQTATFSELDEPPSYFRKEVKLSQQMNVFELSDYIRELGQSGLDTIRLQVQMHSKFSVPFFALIMALISVPFAFLTGNRGAMAGVGVSLGIAIAYWTISKLFEQIGFLNQLPPAVAAWAPDVIFGLAGLYLMARMRT